MQRSLFAIKYGRIAYSDVCRFVISYSYLEESHLDGTKIAYYPYKEMTTQHFRKG